MGTVVNSVKWYVFALVFASISMLASITHSAWPMFEMPAAEPKADRSYVHTSDQTLYVYYDFIYDNRGNLIKKIPHNDPGADGIWFTADDPVWYRVNAYVYDDFDRKTMEIEYDGPGPDGIPLNDDDIINEVETWLYDGNGDIYRHVDYNAAGPDGIWFTADDVVTQYTDVVYDYDNYFIRDTEYIGPGSDGIWFTADDQIEEYDSNYFHSNYRQYFEEDFNGSGSDGQWYTADDVKREQDEYFYDGSWNLIRYVQTKTSGEIDETTYQYDGNNNCTRLIKKDDDVVSYYVDFVYDDQNRMQEAYQYYSPGSDGVWFTSDDTWAAKVVYEFNTSPPTCSYTISPTSQSFSASGGSVSINIYANSSSCSWSAFESLSWVTLSTSEGTGDGSVTVSVAPNSSTSSRSGTVTIAGKTFSASQSGATSGGGFVNGGFETGDLSGWNTSVSFSEGISVVSNYNNTVSVNPVEGDYFALIDLTVNDPWADNYESFITQDLVLNEGDEISGYAAFYNFEQNDTEYCYIGIYDSSLTYNSPPWGNIIWSRIIGNFPWSQWSWTAPASGTYTVHFGVSSSSANSVAMFDMNLPTDSPALDSDNDGIKDDIETAGCTDPNDADTDDDGILDGEEDANQNGVVDTGETNPCSIDSDGDGIQDGTETGVTSDGIGPDTDTGIFIPDADPSTTTDPLDNDSDNDGLSDGDEDANHNGAMDGEETDPNAFNPPASTTAMPWIPLLLLSDTPTQSNTTLLVPASYANIQAAIDAAASGDTVLVSNGVYTGAGNKNLDFNGKAITVKSANGPENTVIDCEGNGRGFYFRNGEGSNSVVSGFTITNGGSPEYIPWPEGCGGGIQCNLSSPTIENCIIRNNSAWEPGGGIALLSSSAIIKNCKIYNNGAHAGGGIYTYDSGPVVIENSIISDNTGWNIVGGVDIGCNSSVIIKNSTITKNSGTYGDGGIGLYSSSLTLINSILWDNSPNEISLGICGSYPSSDISVTYSNIEGGYSGTGNINSTPHFVSSTDFHLTESSPCIDSGTATNAPDHDIEGYTRPYGPGFDIGAYEYHP